MGIMLKYYGVKFMKYLNRKLQLYVLMMVFWLIINGQFDLKVLFFGSFFSVIIIKYTYHIIFGDEDDEEEFSLPAMWRFAWFGVVILSEIVIAANYHVKRIFKNETRYEVFEVHLDTENIVILTLIANAITLTPGTITLEINGSILKVLGFVKDDIDVEVMIKNIQSYQKPFLFRRV